MKDVRTIAFIFALSCILGLVPSLGGAQVLPGRVAVTGGAPLPVSTTPGPTDTASDVLSGTNAAGPYMLSWKPIDRFSELVVVDNRTMQRDLDYDIDYLAGTITFKRPVSDSTIRVRYGYDASKAVPNPTPSTPLSLDLLKTDKSALRFTALYTSSTSGAGLSPDAAVYGLSGNTRAGQGEFSSEILFSPEQHGRDAGTLDDRSAIRFGGSTRTDRMELSTSYVRVGERFRGAKDYGLQEGMELVDVAAVYRPTETLSLSSSVKRTEALGSTRGGETTTTTVHSAVLSPEGAPKLTVARTEVEKERAGAGGQVTVTDKVQLEHQLGAQASAVATHETITTEIDGTEARLTSDQIAIDAKPADNLLIRGRLTQKDSSRHGEETTTALDVEADPTRNLSLKMAVSRRDSDARGRELAHTVKLVSTPRPGLLLELGMTGRDLDRPEDVSARTVKLSTTVLKKTRVQLDWANKESDIMGPEEFVGVRVETTPAEAVKFIGAVGQRDTGDARELSKEARVEVSPLSGTTLHGAYKEVETNGSVTSRVTEVSASAKPTASVELSGAYKSREALDQEGLESVDLALQVDTGGVVKVTGAYSKNPEDKKGIIQRVNSQGIGLRSDFGRFKLRGDFTLKDEYLAGRESETRELSLDYRLSSNSLLTTGYSVDELKGASTLETSTYTVGYTHKSGSRLSIYLGGRMTTYERDRIALSDRTEYEAEARVGVKF